MDKKEKLLNKKLKELKSVYLVYGEENYLLEEFRKNFINKFVKEEIKDFNLTYMEEGKVENFKKTFKNYVNTLPVMSKKRFVVVRCVDLFRKSTDVDEDIIDILNDVPETTILLIIVSAKINRDLKINKKVKEKGEILHLSAPRYNDLDNWITERFKEYGKNVDKKSVNLLEHMYNNKLKMLDSEIKKITTCFEEKSLIRFNDIENIISKDRLLKNNIIFDFVDALSEKNKGQALKILNDMIDNGEVPLRILGMIIRQVRLLLMVKELREKGMSPKNIADKLDEHPYPIKKCYRFSSNFSKEELEILLEQILETNQQIVTGKYQDNKMALEMALIKL